MTCKKAVWLNPKTQVLLGFLALMRGDLVPLNGSRESKNMKQL
jgi:hypothetical protein